MLGPQMPYLDTSQVEAGGGVGLGDYEEQLANAYPWVHFCKFEAQDAMRALMSAIDRHTSSATARMAEQDSESIRARRCYDPAPIAFWAANVGSRVVSYSGVIFASCQCVAGLFAGDCGVVSDIFIQHRICLSKAALSTTSGLGRSRNGQSACSA